MSGAQLVSVLPPAVSSFIDIIAPTLTVLVVTAIWLGVTVPLLFALFYFSTPESRRKALFTLNVISVFIGIVIGILTVAMMMRSMLDPMKGPNLSAVLVFTFMTTATDVFIDSILLFRVFTVLPPRRTRRIVVLSVYGPLLILKLGRVTNIVVFMVNFANQIKHMQPSPQLNMAAPLMLEPKIGWGLQLADNAICSTIFLWRLNKAQSLSERVWDEDRRGSYSAALRTLFWMATSNFVFPAIFAIVQYVLIFRDQNPADYLIVLISNIYVEIIGVLFATVWAAKNLDGSYDTHVSSTQMHTLQFAPKAEILGSVSTHSLGSPGRGEEMLCVVDDSALQVLGKYNSIKEQP